MTGYTNKKCEKCGFIAPHVNGECLHCKVHDIEKNGVNEIVKQARFYWYKTRSDYKPEWVADIKTAHRGCSSGFASDYLDDLLYQDDVLFDTPYEIEITIKLKKYKEKDVEEK